MTGDSGPRSRAPVLLVVIGLLLAVVAVAGFLGFRDAPPPAPAAPPAAIAKGNTLDDMIYAAQDSLRRKPDDAPLWAQLGAAYVEQARITGDPSYYTRSQGALARSMEITPNGNGEALVGLGQLANARHDFVAARGFGEQARAVRPYTVGVYGVLADAYTQLGDTAAATDAVQHMLDVRPGLASFTRASYDLELHGRRDDARTALERALTAGLSPDDIAFCRYYLGELAWNAGQVDEASSQYEQGLATAPQNVALLQGRAKVAAAQGRVDEAVEGYRVITTRVPLPQYLLEYGELLESVGRTGEAKAQYDVLKVQQQLYASQGSTDDLVGSLVAADHGDKPEALRLAQAEWGRRQSVFSADALSWALYVNGRYAEALTYAERANALGWQNATYTFHRGMILAALGRRADALATLRQALATNPHFNPLQAPQARAKISDLEAGS